MGFEAAPHLSCVGSTEAGIAEILATYRAQGIRRLVALRGDLPSGTATAGEFRYAADLVAFIRRHAGRRLAHRGRRLPRIPPAAALRAARPGALRGQGDGPAPIRRSRSSSSTPTPTSTSSTRCAALGVTVPIVPGIMPIHNYARIAQFAARDGIEIPRWVALKMEGYLDDAAAVRAFGIEVVTGLCERLIAGGAPGIHFYTLNQSALSLEICRRLGSSVA